MEASRNHWRDVRVVYCACLESMCAKSTPGSNPGLSARFYTDFLSNPKFNFHSELNSLETSPDPSSRLRILSSPVPEENIHNRDKYFIASNIRIPKIKVILEFFNSHLLKHGPT